MLKKHQLEKFICKIEITKINVAQIGETLNEASYKETTFNDNISEVKVEIELINENKDNNNNPVEETKEEQNTHQVIDNNNTKVKSEIPQTGQTRVLYTALGIIAIICIVGIVLITIKIRKDN